MDILKESISVLKNSNSYSEEECLDALDFIMLACDRDISRASAEVVKTIAKSAQKDKRLKVRQALLEKTEILVRAKAKQKMPELPAIMNDMIAVLQDDNPQNYRNPQGFEGSLLKNEICKIQHQALQVISAALQGPSKKQAATVALRTGLQIYVRKLKLHQNVYSPFRFTEKQNIDIAKSQLCFVQLMVASKNLGQPPSRKAYKPKSITHKPQSRARDLDR